MKKQKETRWHKLDNTAKIFPVIASENLSNVYRISIELKEEIKPELLQEALNTVIEWFEVFHVRLRRGMFWYYFETNRNKPVVEPENNYPCRYISPNENHKFLFRVSYYQNRINLEVFHVLTDGMGALTFLKELTYQYLRLYDEKLGERVEAKPSRECSLNIEDSYLKYYKKSDAKGYKTRKAYQLTGKFLPPTVMSVIHGHIDIADLKRACKEKNVSINQYLVANLVWSIYTEYLNRQPSKEPICVNVPVNLRNYFESTTTKNFFAVLLAEFEADKENLTFDDVLEKISDNLKKQMTKEHMEELISYNVSNEKNRYIRAIPLFLKNIAIKFIYHNSSKAFTTTVTNIGSLTVLEEFEDYIERFYLVLSVAKKQNVKCSVCSYKNELVFTFASVLADSNLERAFFRNLARAGIRTVIESNGVYNEEM
ncbi:WS/DGAT domain-containing protein [Konateibacter massiliensis]|uniref:WS/DGAT domain-containing protein n=1 Tax=Konateibacter massiliensis TaxID=2002841 RepID=UPI000C150FFB|nr:WS/DGAT domain-containing protein [Konateibacter massiliensis]